MKPLLLLLTLYSVMTCAHDLWIERNGTQHSLAYGHEKSNHAGAKKLEYKPENVQQARCFNDSAQVQRVTPSTQYPVTLQGDCAVSWFLLSSGYWSKTPYGLKNRPKNEEAAVIDSWLSVESIKRLDRWSKALAGPVTQELELSTLDNPLALKSGDKLRLRVWFQGKPAANVTVAYFGKPRGVTGEDGTLNIRLNQAGYQHIEASLETPLADGKADKIIRTSSLQFEIQ
jgi:nickel transport protein